MIPGFFANKRNITIVLLLVQKVLHIGISRATMLMRSACCVFLGDRFHLKERDTEKFGARVHEQKFHLL